MQEKVISYNKRLSWIDSARGIGIILVVIGHSAGGLIAGDPIKAGATLVLIFDLIYSFHMPLFFFLSGIFIRARIYKLGNNFLIQSSKQLIWPYFFWSFIQISSILAIGRLANNPLTPDLMLYAQILWYPTSQFWFIYALIVMHLLSFIFYKVLNFSFMLICAFIALLIINYVNAPKIITDVSHYWFFFSLGVILQDRLKNPVQLQNSKISLLVVLIAAWIVAAAVGISNGGYETIWSIPAALFGILMILRISLIDEVANSRILILLGQRSMAIFLTHVLIVAGVRLVFFNLLHVRNNWIVLAIATLAGLVIPCLLYQWAKKRNVLNYLALR